MDNNYSVITNEEEIYIYDEKYHENLLKKKPWIEEYNYNKNKRNLL
jgi:hypothetical protein